MVTGRSVAVRRLVARTIPRSSPWQRGTKENTNRLLRQYLYKNAVLRSFPQDDLDATATKLNHAPRRMLSWATPAEAFPYGSKG